MEYEFDSEGDVKEYRIGENPTYRLTLINTNVKTLHVEVRKIGGYLFPINYLDLHNDNRNPWFLEDEELKDFLTPLGQQAIDNPEFIEHVMEPGDRWTIEIELGPLIDFTKPGEYIVQLTFPMHDGEGNYENREYVLTKSIILAPISDSAER